MSMKTDLILDKDALAKMGLVSDEIWLIEYDLPNIHLADLKKKLSQKKITQKQYKITEKLIQQMRAIRNKLVFKLKFKLMATKNLDSSWLIPNDQLELAKEICLGIRKDLETIGLHRFSERVRILPVITNEIGYETYLARKAEFLLEFMEESQKQVSRGIKDQIMSESVLWRCKKAVEIVSVIMETLKANKRYKEILDTKEILDDSIHRYEAIKLNKKRKKALEGSHRKY